MLQEQVTHSVAERVIDALEAIKVEKQQRYATSVTRGTRNRAGQEFAQELPVRKASQFVVISQVPDPRFLTRAFSRVLQIQDENAPMLVVPRLDACIDGKALAIAATDDARPRVLGTFRAADLADRLIKSGPMLRRQHIEHGPPGHLLAVTVNKTAVGMLDDKRLAVQDEQRIGRLIQRAREARVQAFHPPPRGDITHECQTFIRTCGDEAHLVVTPSRERSNAKIDVLAAPGEQCLVHGLAHFGHRLQVHHLFKLCGTALRAASTDSHSFMFKHIKALITAHEPVHQVRARAHQRRQLADDVRAAHEIANALR